MKRALIVFSICVAAIACKKEETYSETATTDTTVTTATTDTSMTTGTTASAAGAPLNDNDKDWLQSAARMGKAEVEVAQDGVAHATNPEVKALAQKMVDDHTKANTEAASFASSRGVELPEVTDANLAKVKERMAKLTGSNFDQAFVNQLVADHKDAVQKFQDGSAKIADADLKAWVDKTLPVLQDHLKMAQDLQAKIGKR